jgi:hypothetical protein
MGWPTLKLVRFRVDPDLTTYSYFGPVLISDSTQDFSPVARDAKTNTPLPAMSPSQLDAISATQVLRQIILFIVLLLLL